MLIRCRLVLTFAVATMVTLLVAPIAARADINAPVGCDAADPNPYCVLIADSGGAPGQSGGAANVVCHEPNTSIIWPCYLKSVGWLLGDGCYWHKMTGTELAQLTPALPPATPPGHWYEGSCGDPFMLSWVATKFRIFAAAPQAVLLAQQAVSVLKLPVPGIQLNPPAGQMQLVRVPTWLWLDSATYLVKQASVSVPGMVVTATATPVGAVWRTGDGAVVTCGRGTPWRSGADPGGASPTCGHTYTRSSAGQPGDVFTVSATVTWRVTWRGGGTSGRVPDLITTSSVQVSVGQAQTVIQS
jgi:hypothetical protein